MNDLPYWLLQIQRYADGGLDADEVDALSTALKQDKALRRNFLEVLNLDAAMEELAAGHALAGDALASATVARMDNGTVKNMEATKPLVSERPAPPVPSRGAVLGFLQSALHIGGYTPVSTALLWMIMVVCTGIAIGMFVVVAITIHGISVHIDQPGNSQSQVAASSPVPAPTAAPSLPAVPHAASAVPIARLTQMADCRWVVDNEAPRPGDALFAGQSLQLAAGAACMEFGVGAKIVLQGPAQLSIVSAKQIRLDRGKLAAEITSEKAHGFTVVTPQGNVVDLGTEFGVEVAPQGGSKVHVFRGKVEFAPNTVDGKPPLTTQCLAAHSGARMEADGGQITLVEDTGENFVRSLDRLEKDRHVVAYWRFEDKPLGTPPPHTVRNTEPQIATVDSSFNGNDLYSWSPDSRPKFSGDVPQKELPQTHSSNHACLDFSAPLEKSLAAPYGSPRNVYTHSAFSHAAPLDIQKITPAQWTIEASVKPVALGGGPQTMIGRDTQFPPSSHHKTPPPRLALEVTNQARFAIRFYDASNRAHEAVAAKLPVQINHWYHLAAVSDGRILKLYVDSHDGHGYQLRASKELPETGNTALGKGQDMAEWTIGRGLENGLLGAGFHGLIDEVRVSDVARQPGEFLFAPAKEAPAKEAAGKPASEVTRQERTGDKTRMMRVNIRTRSGI